VLVSGGVCREKLSYEEVHVTNSRTTDRRWKTGHIALRIQCRMHIHALKHEAIQRQPLSRHDEPYQITRYPWRRNQTEAGNAKLVGMCRVRRRGSDEETSVGPQLQCSCNVNNPLSGLQPRLSGGPFLDPTITSVLA
jgi:hypothetical protein